MNTMSECPSYCRIDHTEVKWVIITRIHGVDFESVPLNAAKLAETTFAMQEQGIRYRTARA
jgi:hypothetical protein